MIKSTLSAGASPAKTCQLQAHETEMQGLLASAAVSGTSICASSMKPGRHTASLKTSPHFALVDWTKFSGGSMRSGSMRNGQVFVRPTWARHMQDSESSSSRIPLAPPGELKTNLPTPTVSDLYSDSLKSSQQSVGSMHSVTLAQAVTRQDLIYVPDSSLLRTPSAIEGEGGAMRADVKRERGRMLMVRDQMAQLAADNGLPVNDSLLPTPNTMEHREIKTPEQIAEMRERSPGGYRNLREVVINEIGDEKLLPTVTTQDGKNNGAESQMRRNTKPLNAEVMDETNWGQFEPAIRRWETILNRQAPPPTEPTGKDGNHRLSSKFTEWMMGLPDGHVTLPEIGITRNDQLKACGNGVVPQQAEFALQTLLTRIPRKVTK